MLPVKGGLERVQRRNLPGKYHTPFEAADANNQFISDFVQRHIPFFNKREFHFQLIFSINFGQFIRLSLEKPIQRIARAVYLVPQDLKGVMAQNFILE